MALVPFYAGTRIAETVALDVEDVRFGCMTMLGGWCRSTHPSRRPEIERAYRVLIEADDLQLAYIRRCGGELALMTHQIPALRAAPLWLHPHPVTAREIDALHAYTNPARAGYELAKLITGLPDELLWLIAEEPTGVERDFATALGRCSMAAAFEVNAKAAVERDLAGAVDAVAPVNDPGGPERLEPRLDWARQLAESDLIA